MENLFNTVRKIWKSSEADFREFIVSRVNISDLKMLQDIADLYEEYEMASVIYDIRVS